MKLLKLQLISLLCIHPDFQAWFHGHDSTCHDSTLITLRMASQYVNGCKNNGRREFCRGNRNGERNTGWQGKLITKRNNCNEDRIPTNAFCLKRKALLRGKRRHDERLLVINLEFDCRVRMYFCRRFHNGRNIINTANSEIVRWFIVSSSSVCQGFGNLPLVNTTRN